ncbi:hypothetical protein HpBT344_01050 [Helicobacter pylori]
MLCYQSKIIRKDREQWLLPFNFTFPKPTHLSDEINTKLDFKDLPTSFKKPFLIRDAFNLIDYSNSDDADNFPMQHNPKTIERFQYIQEGKNIQECIESLPKHLQISQFYSRGNTMRLKMDALSPTLVPWHSNFPLHPTEHRIITIREAATITGFPTSYKFFGSHAKRWNKWVMLCLSLYPARLLRKLKDF